MSFLFQERFAPRMGLLVLAAVVASVGALQLAVADSAEAIDGLTRRGHHGLKNNEPFRPSVRSARPACVWSAAAAASTTVAAERSS